MSKGLLMSVRLFVAVFGMLALLGVPAAAAQAPTDARGDFDGDGIPNHLDADDDNDGVTDENDAYPFDPARSVREAAPTPPPAPTSPAPAPTSPPAAPTSPPPAPTSRPPLPTAPTVPMPTIPAPDPGDGQEEPRGNPGGGARPTPSIIDADADSDGDGIANSHDPDDDNDGVTDETDCAPFNSSVTECSSPEPTAPPTSAAAPGMPSGSIGGDDGARPGADGSGTLLVTSLPVTGGGSMLLETGMQWMLLAIASGCAGCAVLLRQRAR